MRLPRLRTLPRRTFVWLSGVVALIACVLVLALTQHPSHPSLETYAKRIIDTCAKADGRLRCYDEEVPKVMNDGVTLEDSFALIRLIQQKDPAYAFCHIAGHTISANEYAKDPSKWRDIIKRCPIGICSNGCLHGALQAHFSADALNKKQIDEIVPDLASVCEERPGWSPTNQQQSSCYHEIGHAALYVAGADPGAAYDICKSVSIKANGRNFLQTCTEGVFMQIFQPLSADDFALIYPLVPHKENLARCESETDLVRKAICWREVWKPSYKQFCEQYAGEARNGCYREAWIVDHTVIESGPNMLAYCSYAHDDAEAARCFNKLIYSLMASVDFDQAKVKKVCMEFSGNVRGTCFAHMASRMIETDKTLIPGALSVCRDAESLAVGTPCYKELHHYAGFLFKQGTQERTQLCSGLPEDMRESCTTQ